MNKYIAYFTVAICCRYLASGMTFTDLEFDFHISRKTIPFIVKQTRKAIWEMSPKEMPPSKKKYG
jgi:hypothetical protein